MKETIKSILLVVLVITNFILGSQVLSTQKLWSDDGYNFFVNMKKNPISTFFINIFSGNSKNEPLTNLEAPERIIVNTGYQTSRRALTSTDENFSEILLYANELLTIAFSEEQQFIKVPKDEFFSALSTRSVYLRYPTDYDAALFSYLLGAGTPDSSLGFTQIKNVVISADGYIYIEDSSNGDIYRFFTGITAQPIIDIIEEINEDTTNSSVINYAFDLGFDKAFSTQKTVLSPTIPIYSDSFEVETVIANNILLSKTNSPAEHIISEILPLFNMNPNSFRRYTEVDGTIVYVENNAVLKVTTDGYIHYLPKDDGILISTLTSPNVNDSVAAVAGFVDKVNSAAGLDSAMQLSSKLTASELSSDTLTVTLDYLANGRPVKLNSGSAVSVSIRNGRITGYIHKLTEFERTGKYVYVDNYIDALDAAIMQFENQINGIEINKMDVCYLASGNEEELFPDWYVEVKEIVIDG